MARSLLLFALLSACVPRSAEQVESLAVRAESEPDAIRSLVRALRSEDADVRQEAHQALLDLGLRSIPALREAIIRNRVEAGRALLVLGELAEPDQFPLIREAINVPAQKNYAIEALDRAEEQLFWRIQAQPSVELCEIWLEWFKGGRYEVQVRDHLYQARAWDALDALGRRPTRRDLEYFLERYPDSEATPRARRALADLLYDEAEDELSRGAPDRTLQLLEDVRFYDPQLETRQLEAKAREARGRALAQMKDGDAAIAELEAARELGAVDGELLGTLYFKRAQRYFDLSDPVNGMADLARAAQVSRGLRPAIAQLRAAEVTTLEDELRRRSRTRARATHAIVLAGTEHRRALGELVLEQLMDGDSVPFRQLTRSVEDPLAGNGAQEWLAFLVGEAVAELHSEIEGTMGDAVALEALLSPDDVWGRQARGVRARGVTRLRAYEAAIGSAQHLLQHGYDVEGPIPTPALQSDADLLKRLQAGQRPGSGSIPFIYQMQLLRFILEAPSALMAVASESPALVVLAALDDAELPKDVAGWALAWHAARAMESDSTVRLRDGSLATLEAIRFNDAVTLRFRLPGAPAPASDGAVVDALTVLFGTTPIFLAADTGIQRVDVLMGMDSGLGMDVRVRLSVTRDSAERMNWALIREESPFTTDHLAFVLDQQVQ